MTKRRKRQAPPPPPGGNVEVTDWPNVPTRKAPCCGQPHELPSALEISRPKPGQYAVCAHCAQALIFNEDLTQRVPTFDELRALDLPTLLELASHQEFARTDPWIKHRTAELREAAEAQGDAHAPSPEPLRPWLVPGRGKA